MALEAFVNSAESQLISKAITGSNQAFEELMDRYMDRVYCIALRIVHDPATAEDVTQEVFLIVFKKLHTFRGDSTFSTWLYRITVHRALRSRNKEKRYVLHEDGVAMETIESVRPGPEEQSITEQENRMIRDMINILPEKQRIVMTLRIEQDLPFHDIAKILGRSVGGVKANYFHAVRKLKAAWSVRGKP